VPSLSGATSDTQQQPLLLPLSAPAGTSRNLEDAVLAPARGADARGCRVRAHQLRCRGEEFGGKTRRRQRQRTGRRSRAGRPYLGGETLSRDQPLTAALRARRGAHGRSQCVRRRRRRDVACAAVAAVTTDSLLRSGGAGSRCPLSRAATGTRHCSDLATGGLQTRENPPRAPKLNCRS
jgi:hypothetical protein